MLNFAANRAALTLALLGKIGMPVPKQRHTKSRRNRRRSHHALKKIGLALCVKCNSPILSHTVCQNCGVYKGREIIDVLAKLTKKERKAREKEEAVKEAREKETTKEKPLSIEELSKK